jgi:preprotein translocase subunit YajC
MEGAAPSLFSPLLFLGFLLLFMYIVIIRPQNKRNKEITEMLTNLDVGTEVIAASGIIGKVSDCQYTSKRHNRFNQITKSE